MITVCSVGAANALPWWELPVCRKSPNDCYISMGVGFDRDVWDASGNCWGQKLICPDATVTPHTAPVPMQRADIQKSSVIKSDFDTTVLNGDCYGARKTTANGSMASVNGNFVKVWCPGVLNNPDESVANGEIIISGPQPTCTGLAADGYIAVQNGKCWGKYYDLAKYYIECGDKNKIEPTRMVVLNGADYDTGSTNAPIKRDDANKLFDTMYENSSVKHKEYFHH